MPGEPRADLLRWLDRYARGRPTEVRRVDRWRRRGRSGRAVAREAGRVAARLAAAGARPGDRVALVVPDGPAWHAAFFGALRAGAVAVPLDVTLDPAVLAERARELGVTIWVTERESPAVPLEAPAVEPVWDAPSERSPALPEPPTDPGRTAQVVLTSGTTGAPGAVAVPHGSMEAVLAGLEAMVRARARPLLFLPPPRIAVALPLSHLYGQLMGTFVPSILGARVSMVAPMPAADLARALRDEGAWVLATVPRTLSLLAAHLRALGKARWGEAGWAGRLEAARGRPAWRRWLTFAPLRRAVGLRLVAVVSGGAALEREDEDLWRALGVVVVQGYGLTETAPLVTLTDPFDPAPGTLGRPLPGVEIQIASDGEIRVRGPNVVPGRSGGPPVDAEGWLHTGDLGRLDEAGRLVYLGRKAERIVTPAGINLDPGPVADALRRQTGVLDAVVLERPWGGPGAVAAVLAVVPSADPRAAVRAANETLPDAARVRDWRVWPAGDFHRTRTGKPRHAEIRSWLAGEAPEEGRERPEPADAFTRIARTAAEIAGADAGRLRPDDRIEDVLGSLDRLELVARLETECRVALGDAAFADGRTLGELAAEAGGAGTAGGGAPTGRGAPTGGRPRATRPAATRPVPTRADRIPRARWRGSLPARAARFALRELALRPLWRSLIASDVAGVERLAGLDPPFVVAANHSSELDPGAVVMELPFRLRGRIATTAMWEWFEEARAGRVLYPLTVLGLDLIPLVQRGDWRPTLEIAGRVADRGGCPLVFPEGERTLDGELLTFHRGIAELARDLHLPIVPCGISGLLSVLPKGAHWPRSCWARRAPMAVRFGDPLPVPRPTDDPAAVVADLRARMEPLHAAARAAAGRP